MVGHSPFATIWRTAKLTRMVGAATMATSCIGKANIRPDAFGVQSNTNTFGQQLWPPMSDVLINKDVQFSTSPVNSLLLGDNRADGEMIQRQSTSQWIENFRRKLQRFLQTSKYTLKKGDILGLLKIVLPAVWVANASILLPLLSPATFLCSFIAIISPLALDVVNANKITAREAMFHYIRDSGHFQTLLDFLVTSSLPTLLMKYTSAASDLIQLVSHCTRIQYGNDSPKRQIMHMYSPSKDDNNHARGLVFVVHGGAWGSGSPGMYRLAAKPFLAMGLAVAIVGYRLYPEGDVSKQVQDLELAASALCRRYPVLVQGSELGVTIVGHSSGAHISMMMVVERLRREIQDIRLNIPRDARGPGLKFDSFIGISGPYNIAKHFHFEASRGVEELSPMQPACGGKCNFYKNSPVLQISHLLEQCNEKEQRELRQCLPRIAFVHGTDDDTVPVTSSMEAARLLRSSGITKCEELYVDRLGHSETILELIFGGEIQDAILLWIERTNVGRNASSAMEHHFGKAVSSLHSLINVERNTLA